MNEEQISSPTRKPKTPVNCAPIKKRIHTDMDTVIIGDARKVLFSPKKHHTSPVSKNGKSKEGVTGSDGEMVQEESGNTKMSEENVVAKLQVASLIFDHLPSFTFAQLQKPGKHRKMIRFQMTISKKNYQVLFGKLGIHKDLTRCVVPPEYPFDLFCKEQKLSRQHELSLPDLQSQWNSFTQETRDKYEERLNQIKRRYNEQFNEENCKKREGRLPLYESRKITDLKALGDVLGPLSLQRKYAGFRSVAGQTTVIVSVNSPVRLVYDESDQSLQFNFSVSPSIDDDNKE